MNNTKLPSITIITPSFNQVDFLEQTINSVLEQNYPNLQFAIIDGNSTDGSIDIINKYRSQLDFVIIESDSGQSDAINKGLARATGDIVGWLNSDDILLPDALHTIADHFAADQQTEWLIGSARFQSPDGELLDIIRPSGDFSLSGALFRDHTFNIPQPATFWKRTLLEEVGLLDTTLHYCMDFDLWCRFLAAGHRPKIVDDQLATYRMHPQSKTCSAQQMFAAALIEIEKRYAHHLPIKQRFTLMRMRDYQRRILAINTSSQSTLLRKTCVHPWWLMSDDIRKALSSSQNQQEAA